MFIVSLFAVAGTIQATQNKLPFLSPVFSSHMVLQRDKPNTLWGWTTPGAKVTVTIGKEHADGTGAGDGKWMVRISPPPTGGPYTVNVDGPDHAELDDVLVGDVWICSGQSNMEFGMQMTRNAQAEIAAADNPGIRLFLLQRDISLTPVATPTGTWVPCTPETIVQGGWSGFTAVGYFFGRELNQRLKIPIGLLETSWGGTVAESWTSRQGLKPFKEFQPALTAIDTTLHNGSESPEQQFDKWYRANDAGSAKGDDWAAAGFDDSSWKEANPPTYEAVGLNRFDGVVWYRKEVDLPDPIPAGDATIQLGSVDDMDTTWVDGVKIGRSYNVNDFRKYPVPANVLKPGRNVVTVRCLDTGGLGGLYTPDKQVLTLGDGTAVPLTGAWKYLAGADLSKSSPLPMIFNGGDPNVPSRARFGIRARATWDVRPNTRSCCRR